VEDSCRYDDKNSSHIHVMTFLDQPSNCQHMKADPVLWNEGFINTFYGIAALKLMLRRTRL
jgi:hypothetical protein